MQIPAPQHPKIKNPTRLSIYRHSLGISQKTLSDLSGVPRSSIANYEARVNLPGPDVAELLAAALNLPTAEVFPAGEVSDGR